LFFNPILGISYNAGDEASLTVPNATRFWIYGVRGPNRGLFEIYIDGVSQGTFDQNLGTWVPTQVLYNSPQLPVGGHTLRFVNRSTNPDQSQASFDYIKVRRQR